MGSMDQGSVDNMSFGIHKKNTRGRYQLLTSFKCNRKLQFDFVNQQLFNMDGETDKALRSFAFKEICLVQRDQDNPLSFLLAFRDSTPFYIYARSKRDADLMIDTIEKIIENNKKTTETQVYYQFVEIKRGYVMQKVQLAYQKRWVMLYKWQMVIKREEGDQHPILIRALYNVPLAKFTSKQENGQHAALLIGILFDDDQFTLSFESSEVRDQWFAALLYASQDERGLATEIPPEQLQLKVKSKEQVKVEQEMEAVRSERLRVAAHDTEVRDERHRLAIVVDELRSRSSAAENEVQRLSLSMSAMDEEQKQLLESIKKLEKNIQDDDAKKGELEGQISQYNAQVAEIKHEITKADIDVKLKQNDVGHIDNMDDSQVVKRKRLVNSALSEGEQRIADLQLEQQETQKKSVLKLLKMEQIEKEIENMMNEVKELITDHETQIENNTKKDKEQSDILNLQKNAITSRLKELEVEVANSKEAYDSAIVNRNSLMDELKARQQKRF